MEALTAAPQIRVRCHYCSQFKPAGEIVSFSGGVRMCWACHERHSKAVLQFASEHAGAGCQCCNATLEELQARYATRNVPMTVVWKDGCYQMLCRDCANAYIPKRLDLFGDTEFGYLAKLKGAH